MTMKYIIINHSLLTDFNAIYLVGQQAWLFDSSSKRSTSSFSVGIKRYRITCRRWRKTTTFLVEDAPI